MHEVVTSDEELQMRTKAMVQKQSENNNDTNDGRGRRSLGERMREKFHSTFYASKEGESKKRELDRLIEEEKQQKVKE
jgi:hypothetical protein